ncbi:hypothetical protein [Actinocorallia sp. A-T 12471]|uniref:hypothetical protein n=1 Tax=Actinocorallia sp. A-T 12471 TaxID=3089813 RepID=UPI0029CFE5BB|nr:hypothetical protein [Actinocorallia sp. A-T 12471]MDX6741603.1 hypothetical protein [Actinocorallia sp. A-T 12471]
MFMEVTLRRVPPDPNNSPVDGIRILAMLPRHWRTGLRRESGDVIIEVRLDASATARAIRREISRAIADPSVGDWEPAGSRFVPDAAWERGRR